MSGTKHERNAEIIRRVRGGETLHEAAAAFGVSPQRISQIVGSTGRPRGGRPIPRPIRDMIRSAVISRGETLASTARAWGVSITTVHKIVREAL